MRTVEWDETKQCVRMIDQRRLPGEYKLVSFHDHRQVSEAIRLMVVRGAPAIGAAAGYGLALAAQKSGALSGDALLAELHLAA